MKPKTLHAGFQYGWDTVWLEHEVDFEFTKRIKYEYYHGDFKEMYLEIERDGVERKWYTFWKLSPVIYLHWVPSKNLEYKHPHDNIIEEIVDKCNDVPNAKSTDIVKVTAVNKYGYMIVIDTSDDWRYDLRISKNMSAKYLATCLRELANKIDENA